MSNNLFLYGTLLPEHAPGELALRLASLRRLGEGTVRGALYDFGEYPGAVLDANAGGSVYGTIFELPEDGELLRILDNYEGFDPMNMQASLFVRVLQPVTLADGETVQCWMYLYNRKPGDARRIPSGRYAGIERTWE